MAISKLISQGKWVSLASSSPSSGTVVSFTSIPTSYRDLKLVVYNLDVATSGGGSYTFDVTFNNDTAANYSYVYVSDYGGAAMDTKFPLGSGNRLNNCFDFIINDANQLSKRIIINHYGFRQQEGAYQNENPIDRIDITTNTAISNATIKIFGRN